MSLRGLDHDTLFLNNPLLRIAQKVQKNDFEYDMAVIEAGAALIKIAKRDIQKMYFFTLLTNNHFIDPFI